MHHKRENIPIMLYHMEASMSEGDRDGIRATNNCQVLLTVCLHNQNIYTRCIQ